MTIHSKPTTPSPSLEAVMRPVETARGLPNEHYIDEAVFAEESKAVLLNNWAGVGFGKDVPNAGDVKPIDFLGQPLLLTRDEDGLVRVFQNVCRHRGMILVDEAKNITGAIRCPYHSWCYSLAGELKATPHVGGPGNNAHDEIKRDDLGLLEVRSYVWRDVVFVNISGDAPEFEEYASDVMQRWKEFDQPLYHGGETSSFKLDVKTNWKLAVENYCESYHLPWIHPGLNSYSRLEDHYNIEEPGAYSGQGSFVYQQLKLNGSETFPDFKNLSEKWDTSAEYIAFFPNVLFGVHRDHAYAILLEPKAIDETVEHIELYYSQPLDESFQPLLETNAAFWKSVFEEDIFVVEGMQKGRRGGLFDGGKFSPVMDTPTHIFHHWVASHVNDLRTQKAEQE
ncbi:MAG: aromatic ring-hydroxylating dioxygenase subunit alpha [Hyphomicrobiales bacterium]